MGSCVRFKTAPGIFFHTRLYSGGRFKTAPGIFFHTRLYSGGRFTKVRTFMWSIVNLERLISIFNVSPVSLRIKA